MQPIHSREARWFWQWDRLEIARGIGYSLFFAGALLAVLCIAGVVSVPFGLSLQLSQTGIILFLIACCLDSFGPPMGKRAVRCRHCHALSTMGAILRNGWVCARCGCRGRFDNLGARRNE